MGRRANYDRCQVDGCTDAHYSKKYCAHHYFAQYKYGDPLASKGRRERAFAVAPPDAKCSVGNCDKPFLAKGMCKKHYHANYKHGDPNAKLKASPGSGTVSRGYRYIHVNGKKCLEHRHKMELKLGRPLLPKEEVHHINGVRDDNRPENLELWSTSQPAGQRVVDKLRWAREIIELYGELDDPPRSW